MTKRSVNKIELSFITINYNGYNHTVDLLQSIKESVSTIDYEVIVVDNNSSNPNEIRDIEDKFPDFKYIRSKKNLGFAGGNNLGIEAASGEHIMLINNDTIIVKDHFDQLIKHIDNDDTIGAATPLILFTKPQGTIQFAGYSELSPITLRNRLIGFGEQNTGKYPYKETPYCHGAAMVIKRDVIEKIGKMFEGYFLYYEELDWSLRIREGGYKLIFDPVQEVLHKESATVGASSYTKTYYLTRNRLLFAKRNIKGGKKYISLFYQLFIAAPKNIIKYLLIGDLSNTNAVISGCYDFLKK